MLTSYLSTAIRVSIKQKLHTLLNVIGFSIGIAAAIIVALFAQSQLIVDKHQPDANHVYRVHLDLRSVGVGVRGAIDPRMPQLMQKHSQIKDLLIISRIESLQYSGEPMADIVKVKDQRFKFKKAYVATPNLAEFVNISVLHGDLTQALSQPNLIALSQTESKRLFGDTDVIGRQLEYDGGSYEVAAVFADLEANTHFDFDVLMYLPKLQRGPFSSHVYLKLQPEADPNALAQEMTREMQKRAKNPNFKDIQFQFIPLTQLHFHTNGTVEMKQGGSYLALQVSVVLSTLLVIIASVNFINFNIASAAKRAKEVGIRKALGASKSQLVTQFLSESLLIVLFSGFLGVVIVELALPHFNQLIAQPLTLVYNSLFMLGLVITLTVVGLFSGLYPALFISSFGAKKVLSGDFSRGRSSARIRKITLCLQGAIGVGLIAAISMLYQQMMLVKQLDVGYEKAQRIIIRELPSELIYQQQGNALLDELGQISGVAGWTLSDTNYATAINGGMHYTWPNGETYDGMLAVINTGYDVIDVLGLKLITGRGFSRDYTGDWYREQQNGEAHVAILITKKMAHLAGYEKLDEVIGVTVTVPRRKLTAKVVGVVEDIRIGSVNNAVQPTSLMLGHVDGETANVVLKIAEGIDPGNVITEIEQVLAAHLNRRDIEVQSLYDEFLAAHKNELYTLTMLSIFSPLAIFLTLLGTFGLASFTTLRKEKELAIRKVLGASRIGLISLVAKEYLWLSALSMVLAVPLTYWLVGEWLNRFNERINQSIWIYGVAGLLVILLTWLTVVLVTYKVASRRPSSALRYE
ncbi:FtsX-like permease family protein [Pseudoalteromonas sp. CO348]|uniref:FtsX-like permease family protein n=1 Tax=Pseudoalteromonas sp. CO348 TaxID=1777271 RepID=UPI00102362DB|nr:FtsX-like permease family protein [Pseudoalteromonas sp. CO348]RZG01146.1 FtsX-like permease family protein [Pseudoalteromonas sp. CO348]